jgi:hypothetical protein
VLYQKLCAATGQRQDPCVLDTFMAATDFMRGAPAAPLVEVHRPSERPASAWSEKPTRRTGSPHAGDLRGGNAAFHDFASRLRREQ